MVSHSAIDLSVVVPALDGTAPPDDVLRQLRGALDALAIRHELLPARGATYGEALLAGIAQARGEYVLTVDADVFRPDIVDALWRARHEADVTVASRYVVGGRARMPAARRTFSRLLNTIFRVGLNIPLHDFSSGFRLYRAPVLRQQQYTARGFEILQEILIKAYAEGWTVREVPFVYTAGGPGGAHRSGLRIALDCLATVRRMWRLRNSIMAADYDDRAHDSRIPLQRYWQRSRFRHITELMAGEGPVLDVGCGSSQIIGALPAGSVGVDLLQRKLRYARKFGRWLVRASGFLLPFPDRSFSCVVCSQVIEHVPKESPILSELLRVLAPGGRLILGTPDYDRWEWVVTEKAYGWAAPGGYADEHIAHYSYDELRRRMEQAGLVFEAARYILRGELILAFRRPAS